MTTWAAQWDGYLEDQDLTGLDRERVRRLGPRLHRLGDRGGGRRGVTAGAAQSGWSAVLLTRLYLRELPGLRGRARPGAAARAGRHLSDPTEPANRTLLEAILWTLWGKSRTTKEQIRSAGRRRRLRHRGRVRARGSSVPGAAHPDRGQLHAAARGPLRRPDHVRGGARRRAATSSRCWGWTTPPSGRRCSPSRSSWRPSPVTPRPSAAGWSSGCSASPPWTRPATRPARTPASRPPTTTACGGCWPTSMPPGRGRRRRGPGCGRGRPGRHRATGGRGRRGGRKAAAAALDAVDRRRQEHDALVIEGRGARSEFDTSARR